ARPQLVLSQSPITRGPLNRLALQEECLVDAGLVPVGWATDRHRSRIPSREWALHSAEFLPLMGRCPESAPPVRELRGRDLKANRIVRNGGVPGLMRMQLQVELRRVRTRRAVVADHQPESR